MGYQLNKPDLRREMEAECTKVANGQKSKEDVLGPVLAKMLECFRHANAEVHKLDEAVSRHFNMLGSNQNNEYVTLQPDFSICGQCKGTMMLKQMQPRGNQRSRDDNPVKILQCMPCSQAYLMPKYHQQVHPGVKPNNQQEPMLCPLCQFQVVKISNGDSSYHICPKCHRDAPIEHGGDASTDFPCTKCTNKACPLSGGVRGADIEVFPCPFCPREAAGKVSLKKHSTGYRLQCSNGGRVGCQYTIWLPKEASDVSVDGADSEETNLQTHNYACNNCSNQNKLVRKLKFIWKPGSVPPMYDRETTACVLCDRNLKSDFHINIPDINRVNPRRTNPSTVGRGRNYSTTGGGGRGGRGNSSNNRNASTHISSNSSSNSAAGRGGGGGSSCYHCGQPGHFANVCPNRH